MKKILWLSRHNPKKEQKIYLKKIFGEIEIVQRIEKINPDPAVGVAQILSLIEQENADELVAALPVQHLQELINKHIFPIRAIMVRTPSARFDGNGEREFDFQFRHFERVIDVKYKAIKL